MVDNGGGGGGDGDGGGSRNDHDGQGLENLEKWRDGKTEMHFPKWRRSVRPVARHFSLGRFCLAG